MDVTPFTVDLLHKAMDGLQARHKAITSNIANAETPHYNRRDVMFEEQLKEAVAYHQKQVEDTARNARNGQFNNASDFLSRASNQVSETAASSGSKGGGGGKTAMKPIGEVQPEWTVEENNFYRSDENGVDVETEMVRLAKNTGKFQAMVNLQSRQFRMMNDIIDKTSS